MLSWQRVRPEVLAQPSEHGRMHEQSLRRPEARRQLALHAHSGPASAALGDWVPAQLPGRMHGHCIWSLEYRHPVEGAELVDVHCEPRNEKPRSKAGLVDGELRWPRGLGLEGNADLSAKLAHKIVVQKIDGHLLLGAMTSDADVQRHVVFVLAPTHVVCAPSADSAADHQSPVGFAKHRHGSPHSVLSGPEAISMPMSLGADRRIASKSADSYISAKCRVAAASMVLATAARASRSRRGRKSARCACSSCRPARRSGCSVRQSSAGSRIWLRSQQIT